VYLERIEETSTEKQADTVANLIDAYDIDQGVMDSGGGTRQVEKLEGRYAERMMKCSYISRPEKPFEVISAENRIVVDRTWAIETIIDLITRATSPNTTPRVSIPTVKMEWVDWIVDQFTCIEGESVDLPNGKKYVKYTHPPGSSDDALHACVYAYLAWASQEKNRWGFVSV
jgi:hypothetical protein